MRITKKQCSYLEGAYMITVWPDDCDGLSYHIFFEADGSVSCI